MSATINWRFIIFLGGVISRIFFPMLVIDYLVVKVAAIAFLFFVTVVHDFFKNGLFYYISLFCSISVPQLRKQTGDTVFLLS